MLTLQPVMAVVFRRCCSSTRIRRRCSSSRIGVVVGGIVLATTGGRRSPTGERGSSRLQSIGNDVSECTRVDVMSSWDARRRDGRRSPVRLVSEQGRRGIATHGRAGRRRAAPRAGGAAARGNRDDGNAADAPAARARGAVRAHPFELEALRELDQRGVELVEAARSPRPSPRTGAPSPPSRETTTDALQLFLREAGRHRC